MNISTLQQTVPRVKSFIVRHLACILKINVSLKWSCTIKRWQKESIVPFDNFVEICFIISALLKWGLCCKSLVNCFCSTLWFLSFLNNKHVKILIRRIILATQRLLSIWLLFKYFDKNHFKLFVLIHSPYQAMKRN